MNYIGIDWGHERHQVCVMDEAGRVTSEFAIEHNWTDFERLKTVLEEVGPLEINLERPNGLLVDWLVGQGWAVYFTPPHIVQKRRLRASKDDRRDAQQLALLKRDHDPDCLPVCTQSEASQRLSQLVQAHDQLQHEQQRLTNQLRSVLTDYYPIALTLFKVLCQPLTLSFLEAFPTPQAAQAASREDLLTFFRRHTYRYMARVEQHYQRLQTPMPTLRDDDGLVQHMLALVAVLRTFHAQLDLLKRQIRTCFATHPDAAWWRAFPGAGGPLTAPRLLARIGDNRQRFPSPAILQAVAGTAPVTAQSGKRSIVSFRLACSRPLRRAAIDLARFSIPKSGWAKAYFLNQRARGHSKSRALRALANRWLRILWTCWLRRELYSESIHLTHQLRQADFPPAPLSLAA